MEIDSITQKQLDLLINIVTHTPLFSIATIPEGHRNYEAKGKFYEEVAEDVKYLQDLGFVDDITDRSKKHTKIIQAAEEESGYTYRVYVVNKMGILMFQEYSEELKREKKYKYSIN